VSDDPWYELRVGPAPSGRWAWIWLWLYAAYAWAFWAWEYDHRKPWYDRTHKRLADWKLSEFGPMRCYWCRGWFNRDFFWNPWGPRSGPGLCCSETCCEETRRWGHHA
jgi:hypothetical protein